MASQPTEYHEEDVPLRGFQESFWISLVRARETANKVFRPLLTELDLTEQQSRVLRTLHGAESLEVHEISEHALLRPPSVSRILQSLEERELVERHVADYDHRISRVSITDLGRELVAEIAPPAAARYARIEEQFGKERFIELVDELNRFCELDIDSIIDEEQAA